MWPFRKRDEPAPEVQSQIIRSAGELLAAKYKAEADIELKRAEHEVQRMEAEAAERQQVREWKAAQREKLRAAGLRGAQKRWTRERADLPGGCALCSDPYYHGPALTTDLIAAHRAHENIAAAAAAEQRGN